MPGVQEGDIDCYFNLTKLKINALIEDPEMQFAKVIMFLWVRWKKAVKLGIALDPEDVECNQDIGGYSCTN